MRTDRHTAHRRQRKLLIRERYYHTSHGTSSPGTKLFFYPFCLDAGKLQPTGSLNFSRLDSARIINDTANCDKDIYAVNYNVLRIENGMAGLLYSN